jgi:hypothetical protein
MIAKAYQKSKAIDRYRERMYEKSDKVKQTITMYEAMSIFNDYLEEISGEWLPRPDGRFIYAQCSECGEIHDTASNYCPSCGCLMDRNDFNAYIKAESEIRDEADSK